MQWQEHQICVQQDSLGIVVQASRKDFWNSSFISKGFPISLLNPANKPKDLLALLVYTRKLQAIYNRIINIIITQHLLNSYRDLEECSSVIIFPC